eukprot:TRINITY_DN6527_c0_g4_i2.p1 TRINITY_DN6527_c0_g4~~TRINITY_DN6527_c0_g4_i2.p1  ORF type:complete len:217 (+),score=60.76 TRINITY_DN6527_c0_g4_i2:130-780(+)
MGGCESKEKKPPVVQQPQSPGSPKTTSEQLRQVPKKSALKKAVQDERKPLVVLDFDMTLTCIHCGKMKLDVEGVRAKGAAAVFDSPVGRLRSVRNFLSDLHTELRATVVILTLNKVDVVTACLEMSGMQPFVSDIIHCSSGRKGIQLLSLMEQYVPSSTVFADDDSRNITDVHDVLPDIKILHVEGNGGLQPPQMEWLYYAAKGDLSSYTQLRATV